MRNASKMCIRDRWSIDLNASAMWRTKDQIQKATETSSELGDQIVCSDSHTLSLIHISQRITRSFRNTSMSEALTILAKSTKDYRINFMYDELEDFTDVYKRQTVSNVIFASQWI